MLALIISLTLSIVSLVLGFLFQDKDIFPIIAGVSITAFFLCFLICGVARLDTYASVSDLQAEYEAITFEISVGTKTYVCNREEIQKHNELIYSIVNGSEGIWVGKFCFPKKCVEQVKDYIIPFPTQEAME